MAKQKFYVVWKGVAPGVYASWEECKLQTANFEGALYKAFESKDAADEAYHKGPWNYIGKEKKKPVSSGNFIQNSLSVDAACSGNPGVMEYRGVYVATGQEIFRMGPYRQGTNNIGEFLALVHGLALLKQQKLDMPVYSDSVNAIGWVKKKKCNTKLEKCDENEEIFDLIARAERWLREHTYSTKILKWETDQWGEIPADFGRK